MTLNDLCSRINLPAVVSHFGLEAPKAYHKIPGFGWYAESKDSTFTFNVLDVFSLNCEAKDKKNEAMLISKCYEYFVKEYPDLQEDRMVYSESHLEKLIHDFIRVSGHTRFYKQCRAEALNGATFYHGKQVKFIKLLEDLGMTKFIQSGVGLITKAILNQRELECLRLKNEYEGLLLLPTYFATNTRLASLETSSVDDLSSKKTIYVNNKEMGWYGKLGTHIVGTVRDLLTQEGCTWDNKLIYWLEGKVLNLHHSLLPSQCIEIWTNNANLITDKNPISLIKSNNLTEHIKDSIGKLTIEQIKELEKVTGQELGKYWMKLKTSQANVSGLNFTRKDGKYYYCRGKNEYEFTNFTIELTKILKEEGEFYQHGTIYMKGSFAPFKIKRKYFLSQYRLMKALSDITLEAGLGIPQIVPNLKHYLTNVVDAFSPANSVEKPIKVVDNKTNEAGLSEL